MVNGWLKDGAFALPAQKPEPRQALCIAVPKAAPLRPNP
jgi:hypothetical protein